MLIIVSRFSPVLTEVVVLLLKWDRSGLVNYHSMETLQMYYLREER